MNSIFKKSRLLLAVACVFLLALAIPSRGLAAESEPEAEEISSHMVVSESVGFTNHVYLFDSNRRGGYLTAPTASLTLSHRKGIGSLYLTFATSYTPYYVVNLDTGEKRTIDNGYIHAFIDLVDLFGEAPNKVQLRFENGQAALFEMRVFTRGKVPDNVQIWSDPVEGKTDLLLFSAHSDDDHLFFAGLLPYYAVERGYQVQVVYLTNHWNTYAFRMHEILDGLWAVGIRSYPVFAPYPDFFDANTLQTAFWKFEQAGYNREDMTGFVVEQLRRFRPMVAVGHDFDGEYGHIQHKVYAQLLADAVEISGDASVFPESASTYGPWDVPKTYIHLYEENPIIMDWDQPMENFEGMTPYEVSRYRGFAAHGSQHETWLRFFSSDKASGLPSYSPCRYGLYRTTVGDDVEKNDMFENVIDHAEQERLAEEEAARLEAEEKRRQEEEQAIRESIVEEQERRKTAEETLEKQKKLAPLATAAWVVGAVALAIVAVFALVNHLRGRWTYGDDESWDTNEQQNEDGE